MAGEAGLWGASRLGLSRGHRGQLEVRGGVSFLTREAQTLSCSSISRSLASPKLSAQSWFYRSPCQPQHRLTQPLAPSCWKLLEPLASASCHRKNVSREAGLYLRKQGVLSRDQAKVPS